jgi:hypothetical protein
MLSQVCPEWYESIGLDVDFHWALGFWARWRLLWASMEGRPSMTLRTCTSEMVWIRLRGGMEIQVELWPCAARAIRGSREQDLTSTIYCPSVANHRLDFKQTSSLADGTQSLFPFAAERPTSHSSRTWLVCKTQLLSPWLNPSSYLSFYHLHDSLT